ncbi:MAG: superoxide dismutase, partial [Chitinophagaceae bacterium]
MSTKTINRRNFLGTSFKGLAIAGISVAGAGQLLSSCSSSKKVITSAGGMGFDQQPLPYAYDALEDVIDAKTMEIHYSKHAAGYSKNLKEAAAAENVASGTTVENLLAQISKYSTKMRNNAGGHFNHELFWKAMRPKKSGNNPVGPLMSAIEKNFTSFENFKLQFANAASGQFGSGWAWLY